MTSYTQTADAEIARLRGRVMELTMRTLTLEADIERLEWLIANGEEAFGTLWRDATEADIDAYRHGLPGSDTGTPK